MTEATAEAAIAISATQHSDPVGFSITARVADRLPDPASDAMLADVKHDLVGKQDNLIFQAVRVAHGTLRSYGSRNDYNVEPVTESVEIDTVATTARSVTARVSWHHEAARHFNFGVSPHMIHGRPILSFVWEDAPQEIREMFANTERVGGDPRVYFREVEHPGIPASRYVQAGTNWLRKRLT